MTIANEDIKRYFWFLFGVLGIVFFWAGVWDGVGYLPYLINPLVSLIVGISILSISGLFLKEFDPLKEVDEAKTKVIHDVHTHPEKHLFHFKYADHEKKSHQLIPAKSFKRIE